ncbi:hypothetical protein FRACA_1620003 [Frankia canadensis]|uniref:Uncharacterized protein n=1 Tax=Frankia canadensis TaxID=1836972 RepID=A0A2I2KMP7_9ACTN|nr:hypothetical protein FRACA_1620003 [Frankia canadensis]SOU54228.1 hypothetical protein FRACA_1620003 [Frankia canadensis]
MADNDPGSGWETGARGSVPRVRRPAGGEGLGRQCRLPSSSRPAPSADHRRCCHQHDSDLAFPVAEARELIPVGVIIPGRCFTAGALRGRPDTGVGRHWWHSLRDDLSVPRRPPA